jgi:hypothetical protein
MVSIIADMSEEVANTVAAEPPKVCCVCKRDFRDRKPKLLPCLHTLCESCITPPRSRKRPAAHNGIAPGIAKVEVGDQLASDSKATIEDRPGETTQTVKKEGKLNNSRCRLI